MLGQTSALSLPSTRIDGEAENKYWIAFDPGETTGFAVFNKEGLVQLGQIPNAAPGFSQWAVDSSIPLNQVSSCIYESYEVFGHKAKAHIGSSVPAAQVIGIIKHLARQYNWELISQRPSILPIAEKWTGIKIPSDHSQSHQFSAMLHGSYYLMSKNIIKTSLEVQIEQDRKNGAS